MDTQEFTDWLHTLAGKVSNGSASIALVSIEDDTASIAVAGDECEAAIANLLLVARTYQDTFSIPDGTVIN